MGVGGCFGGLRVTDLNGVHVGSAHQAHHPLHAVGAGHAGHTHPGDSFHQLLLLGGGGASHIGGAGLMKDHGQ